MVQDSQTQSQPVYWYEMGCGGFDIGVYGVLTMTNSKFINNTHYSEDGWSNFRIVTWSSLHEPIVNIDNCLFAANRSYGGVRDLRIANVNTLNITNCTFANNEVDYPDYLYISSNSTRIVNCIFSNNDAIYDIRSSTDTYIENCLFSKSVNIWRTYNGEPLNWGANNLTGANPLFSGTDPAISSFYFLFADEANGFSPAIDAGTSDPDKLPEAYQIPQYDAFGNNRIHGNGIDIGCYESPGYTGNEDDVSQPFNSLSLYNYPNPFNPETTISFVSSRPGRVRLKVYNLKGQVIKTLIDGAMQRGYHSIKWDGTDERDSSVSSGVYFVRIEMNGETQVHKMMLLK